MAQIVDYYRCDISRRVEDVCLSYLLTRMRVKQKLTLNSTRKSTLHTKSFKIYWDRNSSHSVETLPQVMGHVSIIIHCVRLQLEDGLVCKGSVEGAVSELDLALWRLCDPSTVGTTVFWFKFVKSFFFSNYSQNVIKSRLWNFWTLKITLTWPYFIISSKFT